MWVTIPVLQVAATEGLLLHCLKRVVVPSQMPVAQGIIPEYGAGNTESKLVAITVSQQFVTL